MLKKTIKGGKTMRIKLIKIKLKTKMETIFLEILTFTP